jgi:RNA polymerase subunit RPABC4/transcription elongation factor Spt4
MFFLIGGVQPKTVTLDETPRICPACGLSQARLKRIDHYISLFFIPLFPIKRGVPVLICNSCGAVSSPEQSFRASAGGAVSTACSQCGHPISADFRYCPGCGAPL